MEATVLITGANGTLALEAVRLILDKYPGYTVLAAVRNPSPDEDANTAKLFGAIKKHPGANVEVQQLDLGKMAEVRSFAEKVSARVKQGELPRLSAIICNAATLSLEAGQKFTADRLEATFQVCHLSHYLLVLKLLGSMNLTLGRVVMLGSVTHYPEKKNPLSAFRPEFPDSIESLIHPPSDLPGEAHDRGFQRYGTAKLANVTFMHSLNNIVAKDPKISTMTAVAMDPGGLPASRSQVQQRMPVRWIMMAVNFFMPVLKHLTSAMRPTIDAAEDLVAVSLGPEFKGTRGYYIGRKPAVDATISRDIPTQTMLWESCWKWTGISSEETILCDVLEQK